MISSGGEEGWMNGVTTPVDRTDGRGETVRQTGADPPENTNPAMGRINSRQS